MRPAAAVAGCILLSALSTEITAQRALRNTSYSFDEVLRIPKDEFRDSVAFHLPVGAAAAADGSLYVLDHFENSVRVFGRDGSLKRRFGREGRGPGDIGRPSGLFIRGNRVYVTDAGNRRVIWFSQAGEYQGSRLFPERDPNRMESPSRVTPLRGSQIVLEARMTFGDRTSASDYGKNRVLLYSATDLSPRVLAEFPSGIAYAWRTSNPKVTMPVDGFGVGGVLAVSGDSLLALVDTYRGRIEYMVVSERTVSPVATRDLQWKPEPMRMTRAEDEQLRQTRAKTSKWNISETRIQYPEFRGNIVRALFAPNGDLWLERSGPEKKPGKPSRALWIVIPWNRTAPPYELTLPENFILYSIARDELVGFTLDSDRVPTLRVYRLVRN